MTLIEFEAWVSENYAALVTAAQRVTRFDVRSKDLLHEAVETIIEGRVPLPEGTPSVGWLMRVVHFKQLERYERDVNYTRLLQRFMAEAEATGLEEALADPARTKSLRKDRRYKAKKKAERQGGHHESPSQLSVTDVLQGQIGDTRWVYQQRRDAKLYDIQALRSLGEHIRGRSSRSLHGAGRSLVHWGAEGSPVRPWGKEVKGYLGSTSWCFTSCSTGYSYKARRFGMGSPHRFAQCGGCSEHAISGRHDNACALRRVA